MLHDVFLVVSMNFFPSFMPFLRLYLVEGPYGFSIARAEFAPVN